MSTAQIQLDIAKLNKFVPEIFGNEVLLAFRNQITMLPTIMKSSEYAGGFSQGETLNIPVASTFAATKKTITTGSIGSFSLQPVTMSNIPVVLDTIAYVDFAIEDPALAMGGADIEGSHIQNAAIALAEQIEADILAQGANLTGITGLVLGSGGTTGYTSINNFNGAVMRGIRDIFNNAKIPKAGRHVVMQSVDDSSIQADTTLASFFAFANSESIKTGDLPMLYGIQPHWNQQVPSDGGSPERYVNIAYTHDTFMAAFRRFKDIPSGVGVKAAQMIDPISGVVLRVIASYDHATRTYRISLDILYGMKTLAAAGNGGTGTIAARKPTGFTVKSIK